MEDPPPRENGKPQQSVLAITDLRFIYRSPFFVLILDHSKENFRVLTAWSAIWVVLASAALSLRLLQKARQRRAIASSSPSGASSFARSELRSSAFGGRGFECNRRTRIEWHCRSSFLGNF